MKLDVPKTMLSFVKRTFENIHVITKLVVPTIVLKVAYNLFYFWLTSQKKDAKSLSWTSSLYLAE